MEYVFKGQALKAISQGILGIQPDYQGLKINPCIPRHWPGFTAQRHFRGAYYRIEVKNPRGVCRGVSELKVNGKVFQGDHIPMAEPGSRVEVQITFG